MKSNLKEGHSINLLSQSICLFSIILISNSALAEYYIVYSTGDYVSSPPPVLYYQAKCSVI
ncbi:MAG TPA: hypothetical protein VN704_11065, partial [Verrucomicrobiae bacterium]|nr:hypothetical protein [Verrucomicrobiae bacterium]